MTTELIRGWKPKALFALSGFLFSLLLAAPLALPANAAAVTTRARDFNRVDRESGSAWSAVADGALTITGQVVVGSSDGLAGDIRTANAYPSDQFSQVEVTSTPLSGDQWVGPAVRMQDCGQNMYLGIYFWNHGSPQLRLYKRSAGAWVQLGSSYSSGALAAGTTLRLVAAGSRISFLKNGVERIVVSDTSFTGGAPGIMAYGAATADKWTGGAAQSNGAATDENSAGGGACSNGAATGGHSAGGAAHSIGAASTGHSASGAARSNGGVGLKIEYKGTDASGIATYAVTSSDNGYGTHPLRVLAPTNPAPGIPHNFLYVLPVEAGLGSNYGDGLETLRSLDAQDKYDLTIIEPSFAYSPWYADNPIDSNLHYETFMTKDLVPWVTAHLARTGHEQNWLIGFSKSGFGAQDLILKHPNIFQLAASWDFPADMSTYDAFGASTTTAYGTELNFQANYRLTRAFVVAHRAPFVGSNRIWIGGYKVFGTDMVDYNTLLTSEGIVHGREMSQFVAHRWDSGWVPIALAALRRDSANLTQHP
jgi:hypothetical protein